MIKLYQFEPAFGLANASPFCMKLETYLRMAALPFEIPCASLRHLQKAPKGKMPAPLKWLVPPLARRGIIKELHGHGMGRHSRYEFPVREITTET